MQHLILITELLFLNNKRITAAFMSGCVICITICTAFAQPPAPPMPSIIETDLYETNSIETLKHSTPNNDARSVHLKARVFMENNAVANGYMILRFTNLRITILQGSNRSYAKTLFPPHNIVRITFDHWQGIEDGITNGLKRYIFYPSVMTIHLKGNDTLLCESIPQRFNIITLISDAGARDYYTYFYDYWIEGSKPETSYWLSDRSREFSLERTAPNKECVRRIEFRNGISK